MAVEGFEYQVNFRHPKFQGVLRTKKTPLVYLNSELFLGDPVNLRGFDVEVKGEGNDGEKEPVLIKGATEEQLKELYEYEEKIGKPFDTRQVIRTAVEPAKSEGSSSSSSSSSKKKAKKSSFFEES